MDKSKKLLSEIAEAKNEELIATEELSVGYGRQVVISGINISVAPGQILTLIGPNGSGKSTILKTLTTELKKIAGTIAIANKDLGTMKESDIAKKLSMVTTERIKPELMTCRDVIATGRYPYTGRLGILSKEDWDKVDEAIAFLQAEEVADQEFHKISDGQRQRVMIARAFCQDTDIIVLDEPTSFLDMRYKLDLMKKIHMLAKEKNKAIIMSLHELDLAAQISDTIACVDGERVSKVGKPEEIFTGDFIQKLYGVEADCFDPTTGRMFIKF